MRLFENMVIIISRYLDRIAGFCLTAVMVMVVSNVLLRVLFKKPIMGAYDYVGLLTAVAIAMALAYCAVQNGHIAVTFVVEKFPARAQAVIDTVMNTIALIFWGVSSWHVAKYAGSLSSSGVVTLTTQTPVHVFVYLIAAGLLALCLVVFTRLVKSVTKAAFDR